MSLIFAISSVSQSESIVTINLVFPFFWLAGIVILISPLSAPGGWEPTKSEAERQELIFLLRKTEKKWAKRCLVAFLVLIVITLVASLTAALVIKA